MLDLLKETRKTACKPVSTPMDPNLKLGVAEDDAAMDKESHQRLVGRLIHLSHTRPYIAYVVSVVGQFMQNPKEVHLEVANQILQYLKRTSGKESCLEDMEALLRHIQTLTMPGKSLIEGRPQGI